MVDISEAQKFVSADIAHQNFINTQWRPYMAWLYMAICGFDFLVAPILWPIFEATINMPVQPWDPITLKGAGLFHMAMAAILGITSWQRSQERISAMNLQMTYNDPVIAKRKEKAARLKATETDDADLLIGRK